MRRVRSRGAAIVGAVALLLGGCAAFSSDPERLDGWSIGEPVTDCRFDRPVIESCEQLVVLAREAVRAGPGVPGLVHVEGSYRNPAGEPVPGRPNQFVVVLQDASGQRRAVGVFCGLTDCVASGRPLVEP